MRSSLTVTLLCATSLFCWVLPSAVLGVETETWTREGRTFLVGSFEDMIAAPHGGLQPGAERIGLPTPPVPVLWDALIAHDHYFVAAGDGAGVLMLEAGSAEPVSFALADQGEVLALAAGERGVIYAATGPKGAVYRIDVRRGTSEEIFRPEATYIWDLLVLEDGDLAVATGLPGEVLRVDPKSGRSTRLWQTLDPHVRCLGLREGKILAGTAGSGWIAELDGNGNAFVLWDSDRTEVVDVLVDDKGTLWAALSGSPGKAESGGTGERPREEEKARKGAHTTITVRANAEGPGADAAKEGKKSKSKVSAGGTMPGGGGALLRIGSSGQPVTVWKDSKETPLDLEFLPGAGLLMATGTPARIWLFDEDGRDGWFDEIPAAKSVSALCVHDGRVLAASSNPPAAALYTAKAASRSRWISDVLDTGSLSRFGRLAAVAPKSAASSSKIYARSGNTSEPGDGWSSWREVTDAIGLPGGAGGAMSLPEARFLQVKVEMAASRAREYTIQALEARYRSRNRPPRVGAIHMEPAGVSFRPLPPPAMTAGDVPVVPMPRSKEVLRVIKGKSTVWRSKKVYEPGALTLTWKAEDPDKDRLAYGVEYCLDRGEPCENWLTLAEELTQKFFSFDSRMLVDGVYRFRVSVDDASSNVAGEGLEAREISSRVRVDHSVPLIDSLDYETAAGGARLALHASDPGGRLSRAEYLDAEGHWIEMSADDGIVDGQKEIFHAEIEASLATKMAIVRVVDAAGNVTTGRSD